MRALIPSSALPVAESCDRVVWSLCRDEEFTVASAWRHFCCSSPIVPWADFVWSKGMILRFTLVMWLVMHGRLYTSDFLFHIGVAASSMCDLCGCLRKTIDHLFFHRSYSMEVSWMTLTCVVPTRFPRTSSDICPLLFHPAGAALRLRYAFGWLLSTCIYYLWMESNKRRRDERRLPRRTLAFIILAAVPFT